MNLSIAVPDEVAHRLENSWDDIAKHTLESLALEAYRLGVLTEAEVQQMLGLSSRWGTDEFLKRSLAHIDYTEADLLHDIETVRKHTIWGKSECSAGGNLCCR